MRNPEPVSTHRSLAISLLRTREAVMAHFRSHLAELKLTEQQWRVLRVLGEDGPQDAGLVAERACVLPPSLSRILKTLVEIGFIETRAHAADARRTQVALTSKGEKLLNKALPKSAEIYQQLEIRLGPQKLRQLLTLLEEAQERLK